MFGYPDSPLGRVLGPWVIVVDAMSTEQAREAGRVLGGLGVSGMFLTGTVASNVYELSRIKKRMRMVEEVRGESQ